MKKSFRNLVLSSFFIALGLILPFFTGQIPNIGNALLPMHFPVLLCGFVCGWKYGLSVGFILPICRSLFFGMPPMFPIALAMAFELAAYGLISGVLYQALPKNKVSLLSSLVVAMIGGRILWGIISYLLYGISGSAFTIELFVTGAFINAIPGIVVQLIIIPIIILSLERTKLLQNA